MSIEIIATGGTFDKSYFPLTGALGFAQSILSTLLEQANLSAAPTVTVLPLMDSLDMTDRDRQTIFDRVKNSSVDKIILIHGTDTMAQTAQNMLGKIKGKTIVFTGAMVPARIVQSDAFFNLGFALCAVQLANPGVYIAMNGQLLPADTATKNKAKGIFEKN